MATVRYDKQDSHRRDCSAAVTGCVPHPDGDYDITLDATVFYPEGGGQPADTGTLTVGGKSIPVTHVQEREGEVYHRTPQPLEPGQQVICTLDWARRLDHLQQHTGEHILSHAAWQLLGVDNVGFHLGSQLSTIDLTRALTPEELDRVEAAANQAVFANRPITARLVSQGELKHLKLRKTVQDIPGDLRVVSIEEGDRCTCCGTHAHHTGEVGLIKILRQESHKGGARLSFLCGGRALADYGRKHRITQEAGTLFSAQEEGILPAIHRLREESAATGARLRQATQRVMDYRAGELLATAQARGNQRALVAIEENCPPKEARVLLNKLLETPSLAVCLVSEWEGQLGYLVGRSPGSPADCRFLCDLLGGLLGGRGGGKESFSQGSAKSAPGWQEAAVLVLDSMLRQLGQ